MEIIVIKMNVVPDWPRVPEPIRKSWKDLVLMASADEGQETYYDVWKDYAVSALKKVSESAADWFLRRPERLRHIWIKREEAGVIARFEVLPNQGGNVFISSGLANIGGISAN